MREESRRAEEKRVNDMAMMVRPGEGIINWKAIVEVKRKRQKEREEQEKQGKPDYSKLMREYNCVQHVQD